jgi:hypothetical protein
MTSTNANEGRQRKTPEVRDSGGCIFSAVKSLFEDGSDGLSAGYGAAVRFEHLFHLGRVC